MAEPFAVASLFVATLGTASSILISIMRSSRGVGADSTRLSSHDTRITTLESVSKQHDTSLGEAAGFMAGQETVNRLFEGRMNRLEDRMDRK